MNLVVSILFAICGSVVAGIALREIFRSINPAHVSDYRPCKGGWWEAEINQCSSGLLAVPQQPVNTYSNLFYLAGGFFLSFYLSTLSVYIFSLTMLYLCFGSALYHATSTRWAGSLDVSGIYAVFSALTIYSLSLHLNINDSIIALIMFLVAVISAYLLRYKYRGDMSLKLAIFVVLTFGFAVWFMLKNNLIHVKWHLIISFILFLMAYVVWIMDKKRIFPFKRYGHGFWHLFTAAAISLLYYGIYLMQ